MRNENNLYFCRVITNETTNEITNEKIVVMRKQNYRTDFLFAKSSFAMGMGSLMGIFSEYYTFNTSDTEAKADRKAMESDFAVAGSDLYSALLAL